MCSRINANKHFGGGAFLFLGALCRLIGSHSSNTIVVMQEYQEDVCSLGISGLETETIEEHWKN